MKPESLAAGHPLFTFESVASTQEVARAMIAQGAADGTVVLASEQTEGRGRLGRRWVAPKGTAILASILVRPALPLREFWQLSFVAAWAAAEAIAFMTDASVQVKWPNDILIDGKKVAGILIEVVPEGPGGPWAVIGIGINVNAPPEAFPPDLLTPATSLLEAQGRAMPLQPLLKAVLEHFDRGMESLVSQGFESVLARWKTMEAFTGKPVRVVTPSGEVDGTALGVDDQGNLRVGRADGSEETILAGDVLLR
ncbi:MAG: biotin--[acetyl-CoA-carboxylase] ligase [Armatimonadetes bacterium]|nr:biotin--[acetyl-CoA-carboxylase] ligase [Armatimonadota bacterium]